MVPHAVRRIALQHKIFRLVKHRTLGTWLRRRFGRRLKAGRPGRPVQGEPVRVAVVGAGKHANHVLMPSLQQVPDLALAAVVVRTASSMDRMRERVKDQATPPLLTRDYREVMEAPDIHAVIVATPSSLHRDMVLDALRCGKHVFCEVSGVVVRSDIAPLRAATARPQAPVLQYGYRFCFIPVYNRMKEALQTFGTPGKRQWRLRYPSSLFLYSAALHMNGPMAWVEVRGQPGDEVWELGFAFRNGDEGVLEQYHYEPPGSPEEIVEVECDGERLVAESGSTLKRIRSDGSEEALAEMPFDTEMPYTPERLADGSDAAHEALTQRGYIPELQAFAEAIRQGGPSPCPLDVAVMHYHTAWALFEAVGTGARVEVEQPE